MSRSALCVGHASYDLAVVVDSFPAENSKTETHLLFESGGGPAANAAWLLARWGVPTTLAAAVGEDDYGRKIAGELEQGGVDCRFLQRSPAYPTPVSLIVVSRAIASRTIINRKSARAGLDPKALNFDGLDPRLLLFDGHELEASLAALEAFPSAVTVLDAGSLRDGTRILAQRVQYLVCSERFAVQSTGGPDVNTDWRQTLARLRQFEDQVVVMTQGECGSVFAEGSHFGQVPAMPGPARDTTAAGDIFHGAFAFALLEGLALPAALKLATVAAGLSVRKFGGRLSIPELADVREHLLHEP